MKKLLEIMCIGAIAIAGAAVAPGVARADCEDDANKPSSGKNFHIEERNGQRVVVIDKVITVCGKVPRPSVVYVLQPRQINYEWENLKQDFLPKVLSSVKASPF